jgi:signal transduction histidine kinase
MQKGLVKYDMKRTDFKDVVLKVFSEKKVRAEKKGLKMEKEIKDGDYYTLGDFFWLKEAVNNLLENSIRYTREGQISVKLEKINGKILLSVKDTGVGITDEDKKNLFTEGGRGREAIKINVDSTGYGLYSVKMIIGAHQGRIWAESEGAGRGSTFFMELSAMD